MSRRLTAANDHVKAAQGLRILRRPHLAHEVLQHGQEVQQQQGGSGASGFQRQRLLESRSPSGTGHIKKPLHSQTEFQEPFGQLKKIPLTEKVPVKMIDPEGNRLPAVRLHLMQ